MYIIDAGCLTRQQPFQTRSGSHSSKNTCLESQTEAGMVEVVSYEADVEVAVHVPWVQGPGLVVVDAALDPAEDLGA